MQNYSFSHGLTCIAFAWAYLQKHSFIPVAIPNKVPNICLIAQLFCPIGWGVSEMCMCTFHGHYPTKVVHDRANSHCCHVERRR